MEQIPSYNLLQAIDPTKIKVPISDRFAKLTLSSNKKQQQKLLGPDQQVELKRQQEKRNSVSRNISKQFDDESKKEQNPLLRSESSKDTECNNSVNAGDDLTMEPLEVSDDHDNPTQLEDDIDLLSQQVASIVVPSKAVSLSSGSTGNLSLLTELFSSESQHSSTSEINNIHIVHNIPINVAEALKQDTMCLNLTPAIIGDHEKTYEMTDDDDEEYEDEVEAITISDTSENNSEHEPDVMTTSSLPSSSENLKLPSLIDDKAERVAAFLRDVSVERRVMVEQGPVVANDTVDQILDNKEIDKIQETLAKSRQIATADTESMTPDVDEECTPTSLTEREKRLKALDIFGETKPAINKITKGEIRTYNQSNATSLHKLATDGTLDNTVMADYGEKNDSEKTPKIVSSNRTGLKTCSPMTPKSSRKDVYRIANDETQCNTEYSMAELTPKNQYEKTLENSGRIANLEKENNTELPVGESYLSPKQNIKIGPRRLASEDTMANTMSDNDLTHQSGVHDCSQGYKTPDRGGSEASRNDENRNKSSISIHSIPPTPEDAHGSNDSIINSSNEFNGTVPQHSITILETDEESFEQKSPAKSETSDNNKLSNSFHRDDTSDDSDCDKDISDIQMPMANINISAKINIKIHIPITTSNETSEDDQNYKRDSRVKEKKKKVSNSLTKLQTTNNDKKVISLDNDHIAESREQSTEIEHIEKFCNKMELKSPALDEISLTTKSTTESVEIVEDEKFVTEAEKLLTQLYGTAWKTPDVIRTLKRSSQSGDKKSHNSKSCSGKPNNVKNSIEKKSSNKTKGEETILDDFSIFRRDIVKTNLDSTRLGTPKSIMPNRKICTEPRNSKKIDVKFKPQRECKPLGPPVAKVKINTRRINNNQRWEHLLDDLSSEGDNASDDEDADVSWSRNASELEDSDFENSPMPKARNNTSNTTKRLGRSDKSDYLLKVLNKSQADEIVYLDLSKDEVEVQDDVYGSPPANHDVTFAARLQDILKTCRHEDKAKLPSSNKKTKRKLFTPNFGNDELEDVLLLEDNTVEKKCNRNSDDEILEDNGVCPFDSRGRPKVLVNKHLESVKTGKPIFQLTPSPKCKDTTSNDDGSTPKTKLKKEAISQTPLTVKSRCPPKSFKELYRTPNYKYSFLKSLDVAVSKSFCHPEALCYRENYRTKKEELSNILYDMYNEKLFDNKLDVEVTWNKKLLNTAGRCLNKKKLGNRSSVVELSDKVLTSADRLRCTLIHELCHAATWIFSGEGGHGSTWKQWARKANLTFPEIPKIGVCHQYDIEYKYTYKCTLCEAKSHAHSKSKKVENIRCSYCHGAIEVLLNKKDKDGNVIPTPVKKPTGFAKFVKDNYKKYKRDDIKHADVMKLLSNAFASLKVVSN